MSRVRLTPGPPSKSLWAGTDALPHRLLSENRGYFLIATSRYGTGLAHELYGGLKRRASDNGSDWLRLGVV